ncbi:asparagine synthase-related protein, partial [Candidatus Pelagibacter bacterium]
FDRNMRKLNINRNKLLLPLSGGYDSRLIAVLAIRHLHKDKIHPVTYCYSKISREYIYANKISKNLSLSGHQFHQLSSQSYLQALDWMVKETGGLVSFYNVHLLDYLRSSYGIEGILSSGFSDALCGFEAHSETKLTYSTWEKSKMVLRWKGFSKEYKISHHIDGETMNDFEILSKEWNESNITSFDEYLYIIERHAKFHLPILNLWRKYSPVINPFISSELIKLFFSMPPKFRFNKILEKGVIQRFSPDVASIKSMSSLVIYGRTGNKVDRLLNRGINFTNMILRSIGFAQLEIPSPRITEQLCKAMHTFLKKGYARSVSQLYDMDIFNSQQAKKMKKISLRVDNKLSYQLHALNCAAVYRLKR